MLKNYAQIDNQNRKNSDILNVVQIKPGINVQKDNSKDVLLDAAGGSFTDVKLLEVKAGSGSGSATVSAIGPNISIEELRITRKLDKPEIANFKSFEIVFMIMLLFQLRCFLYG